MSQSALYRRKLYGRSLLTVPISSKQPHRAGLLKKIRESREKTGLSPLVLDVGAAHGFMARNMVIAGAQVNALELNPEMEPFLSTTLQASTLFLPDSAVQIEPTTGKRHLISGTAQAMVGDFLKESLGSNVYDFIWSGNNLHFFPPRQVKEYIKKVYDLLKPGGEITLETFAPTASPQEYAVYLKAKEAGSLFPGYILTNWQVKALQETPSMLAQFLFGSLPIFGAPEFRMDLNAIANNPNFYSATVLNPNSELAIKGHPLHFLHEGYPLQPQDQRGSDRDFHTVDHFFDHETLIRLFKDAGFEQMEVVYLLHFDSITELTFRKMGSTPWWGYLPLDEFEEWGKDPAMSSMKRKLQETGAFRISIRAQKPLK